MYFSNGWWLGLTGEPLVWEKPQVWRYGPVFRGVYNAFSRYGNGKIDAPAPGNPISGDVPPISVDSQDKQRIQPFLDWIWNEYGGRSGVQLSDETHAPGTPWQRIAASNGYSVPQGTEIPWCEDHAYFANLAIQRGWTPKALNPQFAA